MSSSVIHASHPKYRSDIDGLRAIAVLSVVGFHAFPGVVKGGFIGVDVFFVISGFLISTIIFQNLDEKTFCFVDFYARRVRRIFPSLCIVFIASIAFGWFALLADEYSQLGKHLVAGAGFVSNFILTSESGYFDNVAETKPFLHLWSLAIEEQFYLAWPFVAWFAWKRKWDRIWITLFIVLTSFSICIWLTKNDPVGAFYSPFSRFWELLSGSLLAWAFLRQGKRSDIRKEGINASGDAATGTAFRALNSSVLNILSGVGLAVLVTGIFGIGRGFGFPGLWALVPVSGAMMIIAAGPFAWCNRYLLSSRPAVWFGLISFPLYLWHWPLLSFAQIVESEKPDKMIRIPLVLLAILLSWLTYRWIEQPIRRGRRRTLKAFSLLAAMLILGGFGYGIHAHEGYPERDSVKGYVNNSREVLISIQKEPACLKFLGKTESIFPFCRVTDVGSPETVVVFGDSHALAAYPGIAEYLKGKGVNTVLLANSGCPPLLGVPVYEHVCEERIKEIIELITSRKDVHNVFFFTRGPYYFIGNDLATNSVNPDGLPVRPEHFPIGLQNTVNTLRDSNKMVFYVAENPELSFPPAACVARPLRITARKECEVKKESVIVRQEEYQRMLRSLNNVTVIKTVDTFCPDSSCRVFDTKGRLLYADGDHLSHAGSEFQLKELLVKYMNY